MIYSKSVGFLRTVGFLIFAFLLTATSYAQIVVTNTDDSGTGSLRWAIDQANTTVEKDIINFDIAGEGPHRITPQSIYPAIINPIVIDGTSQTGWTVGNPVIVIDGSDVPIRQNGIMLSSNAHQSEIRGLVIGGYRTGDDFINGFAIVVQTDNNKIQGNFIGIEADGETPLPNHRGVQIMNSSGNLVGGTTAEERNVISGNGSIGVGVFGNEVNTGPNSLDNEIKGNYIGTNADGTTAIGNEDNVQVSEGALNTIIGGITAQERNIISGAGYRGVVIASLGTANTQVKGNFIGTDVTGTVAIPNTNRAINILNGASNNIIGGTEAGARNIISGNDSYAIALQFSTASPGTESVTGNLIQGNYIGLDVSGTVSLSNEYGILITGLSENNTIGGNTASARNIISGNTLEGIRLRGENVKNNVISGNYIGTNPDGSAAIPNGTGVLIFQGPNDNTIGGVDESFKNVISGNSGRGLEILSPNNTIESNFIGTDYTGSSAVGNGQSGITINTSNTTIKNNLISGNSTISPTGGIDIFGGLSATGNQIIGNKIGTNISGDSKLGNNGSGIRIRSVQNVIGGVGNEDFNIIAGNSGNGIFILTLSFEAGENNILGNYIGTNPNEIATIGNGFNGIALAGSSDNKIGNASEDGANVIAYNQRNAILIDNLNTDTPVGNSILNNSIFSNQWNGIDLGNDGITTNDADDADAGPNNLQNFPELSTATLNTANDEITLNYQVTSDPANASYPLEIEVYLNDGAGEGKDFIGRDTYLQTDFGTEKQAIITIPAGLAISAGDEITLTATDANGNTSEFGDIATLSEETTIVTNSWTGDGDGTSWGDPANWSNNEVPDTGTDVVINENIGSAYTITLDVALTINSLTISQTDATLEVLADLIISGDYSHTRGTVTGTGNITVSGLLSWQSGAMSGAGSTILNGGLSMSGGSGSTKTLDGRRLVVPGGQTFTHAGNSFTGLGGAVLEIASGGLLEFTGSNSSSVMNAGAGGASIENAGTIRKAEGTTARVDIQWDLQNAGLVELNLADSHLRFSGAIVDSDGSYIAEAGMLDLSLEAASGPYVFGAGSELIAGASGRINLGSEGGSADETLFELQGTVDMAGIFSVKNFTDSSTPVVTIASTANLVNLGGQSLLVGKNRGRLTVAITDPLSVGDLAIGFQGRLTLSSPLTVNGSYVQDNASASLSSDFNVTVTGLLTWQGGTMSGSGSTILNGGMSMIGGPGSSGNTKRLDGRRIIVPDGQIFDHAGNVFTGLNGAILEIQNGALFEITGTNNSQVMNAGAGGASIENAGTIRKAEGTTARVDIQWDLQNAGLVELIQSEANVRFSGLFNNTGDVELHDNSIVLEVTQTLDNRGLVTGIGTIIGTLENIEGFLSPGLGGGVTGVLNIQGALNQSLNAKVLIELGGTVIGDSYDQLQTNSSDLDGTIEFVLLNGFVPTDGDLFEVMTWSENNQTGTFSTIVGQESQDVFLELNYDILSLKVFNSSDTAPPATIPEIPILATPADEAVDVLTTTDLAWNEADRADTYRVQVATASDFSTVFADISDITTLSVDVTDFAFQTTYYWRVKAFNIEGESDWSEVWSFTTEEEPVSLPAAPVLSSPADAATGVSIDPTLSWQAVADANTYELEVSDASDFSTIAVSETAISATEFNIASLAFQKTYYWRVRASNEAGNGDWSAEWSFSTEDIPDLSTPTNLTITENNNNIDLAWEINDGSFIDGFRIYRGASADQLSEIASVSSGIFTYIDGEQITGTVFYAVKAFSGEGTESDFSNVVSYYNQSITAGNTWQMISIPVKDGEIGITQSLVYGFDGTYIRESLLVDSRGYWIKSDNGEQFDAAGVGLTEADILLSEGWNMIGSLVGNVPVSGIEDPSGILTSASVFHFETSVYVEATELQPNKGYWVFAESEGTISLKVNTAPTVQEKTNLAQADQISDISTDKIVFSQNGTEVNLEVSNQPISREDKYRYLRPPMAPDPVLDVRTVDDYGLSDKNTFRIKLTAASYPVAIRFESNSSPDYVYRITMVDKNGQKDELNLVPGKPVILDREYETLSLEKLMANEAVFEMALEPSYPNPFNPSTNVQYALSNTADVSMDVYDITGRKVATLVNQQQSAGIYTITFNASRLASGIYFLRFQAGSFSEIQKLTLIK